MSKWQVIFFNAVGLTALCALLLLSDRMSKQAAIEQVGHNPQHQRDGQGRSQNTETPGTCRDAGGSPYWVGDEFVGCYTCQSGLAGQTCARQ
jgi:hypothetical protein